MKKRIIAAVLMLVVIISAAIIYRQKSRLDPDTIILSGNVEVTEINLAFKVPGRVMELATDEGRRVRKGQKIAVLDSAELASVVNQNRANVLNAQAQYDKALKDLERYEPLLKQGAVSQQQFDSAKTSFDVASSQLVLSRAALKTAEVRHQDTMLYAPLDGVVLRKNIEQGETVAAGIPVVTIGDLEKPWIKVYVKEDRLARVKLGQRAEIAVDSFPGKKYEGTVAYIAAEAEFTPKNVQTREERVKLVFGVKVNVHNQNDELKPGLPADVRIFLK